jgi:hypothetical protein
MRAQATPFAANVTDDDKVLYLKIHGFKVTVPALGQEEVLFTIPYTEAFLQGAEIFSNVLCQTDLSVKHPVAGVIEQYGYDVVVGEIKYKRQAQYASRLPQGLQISAVLKNTEDTEQEMGVNFVLHELRDEVV